MKRALRINISGRIFHIDEDAYQKLDDYLKAIEFYFKNSDEKEEIISDIESRISELFQNRMSKKKEVLNIEDVDDIMKTMGTPEDISGEPVEKKQEETRQDQNKQEEYSDDAIIDEGSRRLYRDPDDRVLGGICSGLGLYFGLDSWVFRVVFLVFTFIFGTGPLIYIALWIIIPQAENNIQKMEMRGEKIDIKSIENSIKQEFKDLKNTWKKWVPENW